MTDQSLRAALEALRADLDRSYPRRAQYDIPSTVIDRVDAMLAAHPAEPAVEVAPPGCHCGASSRWHLDEDCPAYGKHRDPAQAPAIPVPTREQIEEVIATQVMRYDSAADVRSVDDNDPEALDAGVNGILALLTGKSDG